MPIRTFVAVWPPSSTVAVDPPPGVRLVPPERRHATLRFLGDVPEDDVATVGGRLRVAELRPARATVATAATTFGPSILVVRVDGLDALAAAVVAATAGIGSRPPDDRPFRGHVTLARGRDLRRVARGVAVPGGPWDVDEVTVVTSRLAPSGPTYEIVARVPLG